MCSEPEPVLLRWNLWKKSVDVTLKTMLKKIKEAIEEQNLKVSLSKVKLGPSLVRICQEKLQLKRSP